MKWVGTCEGKNLSSYVTYMYEGLVYIYSCEVYTVQKCASLLILCCFSFSIFNFNFRKEMLLFYSEFHGLAKVLM